MALIWAWIICAVPGLAVACAYPAPLRSVNTTLLAVLEAGGEVSIHHRNRLARTVGGIVPDQLKQHLAQDVARRDARAAAAVIDVAVALADGRGIRLSDDLRDPVARLGAAIQSDCAGSGQVAGGADAAVGAEHGTRRDPTQGARALTFREGVARLSLTFTVYMTFLAFLLGVRRYVRNRPSAARADMSQVPDKPEGAP
ncbi:hypothetical protein [uncultured Tateyamaria sp.]|uniref:hypothetical protein n=1 Tax=uncultured Tateyamaria sp. TaxID=455651 RepID=UPI002637B4ED|nr:hypothetical protein [uncultured Tateyamaria sp.]